MTKINFKRLAGLFFTLIAMTSMASCSKGGASDSNQGSSDIVELECDPISNGSIGGILIDVAVNRFLANDSEYVATFKCNAIDPTMTFKSSRPDSVTIEKSTASAESFIIVTHNPGDSILQIYDYQEILVYRNVIRVRQSYSPEDIKQVIYDYDIYKGTKMAGNHRMVFNSADPFVGQLSGSDDFESGLNITFTATYSEYLVSWDMYLYTLEVTENETNSSTILSSMCVSRTGDQIILYYKSSPASEERLLNIFFPAKLEYLHKGQI